MSIIIIRNSKVPGAVPSRLREGELSINTYDGKLYYGDGTTVKQLSGSGGGGGGTGTVTSVGFSAGTGISLGGTNPITTTGTITITNSAPDKTVVLNNGSGISVTGTYPNFTISATGGGGAFPYFGTAVITGSLLVSGSGATITGSLGVTGNITGTLIGTASWASNAVSSSYALSSSRAVSSSYALNATSASYVLSASYASTASYVKNALTASYVTTLNQNVIVSGSLTLVTGSDTENLIIIKSIDSPFSFTQLTPSSLILNGGGYATELQNPLNANLNGAVRLPAGGSSDTLVTSINGVYADDNGAVTLTTSPTASYVTSSNVYGPYGSNSILSSSYALTASYVITAQTASYVLNAVSASYVLSASYALSSSRAVSSSYAVTASYILNAVSASYIATASYVLSSSYAISSSYATSASYTLSASYALSASYVLSSSYAVTASFLPVGTYNITASWAQSASNAINAQTASFLPVGTYQITSSWAVSASNATTASYVLNTISSSFASTASYVLNSISASFTTNIQGGTQNYIPKWATNTTLGSSVIYESSGRIGIGITTPSSRLSVSGSLSEYIIGLKANNSDRGGFFVEADSGISLFLETGGGARHLQLSSSGDSYINSSGNLGIGKTSPNTKLDINGNVLITGSLTVTNGITGSLFGTSSWATNALTASYVVTAQTASYVVTAQTASYVLNAISASFSTSASYAQTSSKVTGGTANYVARWTDDTTLSTGTITDNNVTVNITGRFAQGNTTASGVNTHTQGLSSIAYGNYSHAEGEFTTASGEGSHAEGLSTTAFQQFSHAEGSGTITSGSFSHAEGYYTIAIGQGAHAEGQFTTASGIYSHAEGTSTVAVGFSSHAEGQGTIASGSYQLAVGKYNQRGNTTSLFVIGNGTGDADANRSDVVRVETTGIQITGSLVASGSSHTIIGTLNATSSWATNAITASYALTSAGTVTNALTASYITSSGVYGPYGANSILSSSYALTASYAMNGGGSSTPAFPYTGSAGISGSLAVVGPITLGTGSAPALYTTTIVTSIAGVNTIYSVPTSSYDGMFVDYTVRSGSNARAGQIMTIWSGSSVNFTETTTTDFGTTTGVTFGASISGSNMIVSSSTATAGWTIKSIIRSI